MHLSIAPMGQVARPSPWSELTTADKITRRRAKTLLERQAAREGLRPSALAVLLAMIDTWQPDRPLRPSIQHTIASMKGRTGKVRMAPSTAYEQIKILRDARILFWQPRRDEHGHNRSSDYWFYPEFFERAGLPAIAPPYSDSESPRPPKARHKREPSRSLIRSSSAGSVDLPETGSERHAPARGLPDPAFISPILDDPAFVLLARLHLAAHCEHYNHRSPRQAGTIRRDQRAAVAQELRNLAARAVAIAQARNRDDITADVALLALARLIVADYMALDRPWLNDRRHPLGGLWNGTEGKPCDLVVLGARALERWAEALKPGEPPTIADVLPTAPPAEIAAEPPTAAEVAEVAAARADLAAAAARFAAERAAETREEREHTRRRAEPLSAATLAELARIDVEAANGARAKARAARAVKPRGGRQSIGTRARSRLLILAGLAGLAAPPVECDDVSPASPASPPPLLSRFRGRTTGPRRRVMLKVRRERSKAR